MTTSTIRCTTAQALVRYLACQFVERDSQEHPFFAGCLGIFGHGNLAGLGQALQEERELPYLLVRNEQAAVHMAAGYARMRNRLGAFACTSSIGPGATNMVTGAALATINRLPVLLLPGDVFARRGVGPVLQQLESETSQDVSVNDCLRPVSRYWDRIHRPEQLIHTLPDAMRVLTSPAQTGAATLALPQDVQAEAFEFPAGLFEKRIWPVSRPRPDQHALQRAAWLLRTSHRPLIVAGGGVIYSEACDALARLAQATGIPVAETQAGRGALPHGHAQALGAVGVTGSLCANRVAAQADLVIGVGTRWSDFTTASKTAFANPQVRFVNINVVELDAAKHAGLSLLGDALVTLEELALAVDGHRVDAGYAGEVAELRAAWERELERLARPGAGAASRLSQAEVIGLLNEAMEERDVLVNAAGSAPGDLHKLFRPMDPKSYHVEYGYSCMGYEIPGGMGVKLAAPDREVFVLIGDGSYLMMHGDLVTAVQEGVKLTIVLVDNHGFASIGSLSRSLGCGGFGTAYRRRGEDGQLSGAFLEVDFAANAASLGARALRVEDRAGLERALREAREQPHTTVIVVETDTAAERCVPGYETWWDVPVAEVSNMPEVQRAREHYQKQRRRERVFHAEKR